MMKQEKSVNDYIKEIDRILKKIMSDSYPKCKNSTPEVSEAAIEVNRDAHKCEILLEKLKGEYFREKRNL